MKIKGMITLEFLRWAAKEHAKANPAWRPNDGIVVYFTLDQWVDVLDLPGFVPVAKYIGPPVAGEIGYCDYGAFRFIAEPEDAVWLSVEAGAGSAGQ